MNEYLSGGKLYGDDFTPDQIKVWFEEEAEAYANLGSGNKEKYWYGYHELNKIHGFDKIKNIPKFEHALGIGSAYGDEFTIIADKINKITIIEPSDKLYSHKIGNITPSYVKPNADGTLPFPDNSFDLITCFGTLHHIPNVTAVTEEMIRVLKPNGVMLIREPIISMGDWRQKRSGLTKNERGIPVKVFDDIFKKHSLHIVNKAFCYTMTPFIQRSFGRFFKKPIYSLRSYQKLDKFLSKFFRFNYRYHHTSFVHRISPTNIFYVIKK